MPPHDLDDETVLDAEAQLVGGIRTDLDDPLRVHLAYFADPRALQMFPQQHAESRRILGIGALFFREVDTGVIRVCGEIEPVFFPSAVYVYE